MGPAFQFYGIVSKRNLISNRYSLKPVNDVAQLLLLIIMGNNFRSKMFPRARGIRFMEYRSGRVDVPLIENEIRSSDDVSNLAVIMFPYTDNFQAGEGNTHSR